METKAKKPFRFYTHQNLIFLLGRKARNVLELLDGIKEVPSASIYHHTHHFLEQHEFLSPEPPNDFAYWLKHILQDEVLGEKIAGIDLRQFSSLREIRDRTIHILEEHLYKNPGAGMARAAPPGEEFHFMKAQTFIFPTQYVASNLQEFIKGLRHVSIYSIYYHMFESLLRVEEERNDFAIWLEDSLGEHQLAAQFMRLDPYTQTLDNLRATLIRLVETRLQESDNGKTA